MLVMMVSSFSALAQLPANLDREMIASASDPTFVRHAGDGSGRLFIGEQAGIVKIYQGGNLLPTNFLNISSKVNNGGEQGFLGLDFHPDYENNGFFFVYYSKSGTNSGDTIIERYSVSDADPNVADPNSGVIVMRIAQTFGNHNGGDIHFGPDGYLYIGMGDGGGGGDTLNDAQDTSNLLGAILRIDINTDAIFASSFETPTSGASGGTLPPDCGLDTTAGAYTIPADNPFVSEAGSCNEIWTYGWRNPYRWSFDSMTGDMIVGDVGQSAFEEVSFQSASHTGGGNYGWRCREGAHDFNTSQCDDGKIFVEPVIDLPQSADGGCSVMGGYVFRGSIAELEGRYVFSDFCGGNINFATPTVSGAWTFETWIDVGAGTRGFGEDEAGNVYHIFNNSIHRFILN